MPLSLIEESEYLPIIVKATRACSYLPALDLPLNFHDSPQDLKRKLRKTFDASSNSAMIEYSHYSSLYLN
jgi:hypothetical protein